MLDSADVVVIGSGGLGAATAFNLAECGLRRVALVDQHDIGSQTSPRAAGMVSCLRKSGFMIEIIKLAAKKIARLTEETGQPLDWVRSGSLKVARRAEDARVLTDDLRRGVEHGLDVERISPEEARRLNPFLMVQGVEAVLRIGDDMYFDPAQVAVGFARAAEDRGATLLPNTRVTRVLIEKSPGCRGRNGTRDNQHPAGGRRRRSVDSPSSSGQRNRGAACADDAATHRHRADLASPR